MSTVWSKLGQVVNTTRYQVPVLLLCTRLLCTRYLVPVSFILRPKHWEYRVQYHFLVRAAVYLKALGVLLLYVGRASVCVTRGTFLAVVGVSYLGRR